MPFASLLSALHILPRYDRKSVPVRSPRRRYRPVVEILERRIAPVGDLGVALADSGVVGSGLVAGLNDTRTEAHFDFNAAGSPVAPGYEGVAPGTLYAGPNGFGWVGAAPGALDRAGFSHPSDPALTSLLRDSHASQSHTFRVDLANGLYTVTVTLPDISFGTNGHNIVVTGGALLRSNRPLTGLAAGRAPAQPFLRVTFEVEVSEGNLQLQMIPLSNFSNIFCHINALDIARPPQSNIRLTGPGRVEADPLLGNVVINAASNLPEGSVVDVRTLQGSFLVPMGSDLDPVFSDTQLRVGPGGAFSFEMQRPSGAGVPTFIFAAVNTPELLVVSDPAVLETFLPTSRRFDFGGATASGYLGTSHGTGEFYLEGRGFGWVPVTNPPPGLIPQRPGGNLRIPDPAPTHAAYLPLVDGGMHNQAMTLRDQEAISSTFRVDIPDGVYRVTRFNLPLGPNVGQADLRVDNLTATGGRLNVGLLGTGSADPRTAFKTIRAIDIRPLSSVGNINVTSRLGAVEADPLRGNLTIEASSSLPAGSLVTVTAQLKNHSIIASGDVEPGFNGSQIVVGANGVIRFEIRRPSGRGIPTFFFRALDGSAEGSATGVAVLEFVSPVERHLDFNSAGSPTAPGYLGVLPTSSSSPTEGFRWSGSSADLGSDRPTFSNAQNPATTPLLRDGHHQFNAQGFPRLTRDFLVEVPRGRHRVTLTLGDASRPGSFPPQPLSIGVVSGNILVSGPPMTNMPNISQIRTLTFVVEAPTGILGLRLSGAFMLHAMDIAPERATSVTLTGPGVEEVGPAGLPLRITGRAMLNDTTPVPAGTLMEVTSSLGTVLTDEDAIYLGSQVRVGDNGAFSFDLQRSIIPGTPTFGFTALNSTFSAEVTNSAVVSFVVTRRLFDFGTPQSAVEPGYLRVLRTDAFNAGPSGPVTPFGWVGAGPIQDFQIGQEASLLTRDGVRGGDNIFQVDLTPGSYRVEAFVSNPTSGEISIQLATIGGTSSVIPPQQRRLLVFDAQVPESNRGIELRITATSTVTTLPSTYAIHFLNIFGQDGTPTEVNLTGPGRVIANPALNNVQITGTSFPPLRAGSEVDVSTTVGTIASPDVNPTRAGVQVPVGSDGTFSFLIQRPALAGRPTLVVTSHERIPSERIAVVNDPSILEFVRGSNTPPMLPRDSLTLQVNEGGRAVLAGQLVDPDRGDFLSLVVDWGDGSRLRVYHPGVQPFAYGHTYQQNGTYNVQFTWVDDRGGFNSRTRQVVVNNVAPQLRDVRLTPAGPMAFTLLAQLVEPGQRDRVTVRINWGDGQVDVLTPPPSRPVANVFAAHNYRRAGEYVVTVTTTDSDGASTVLTLPLTVGSPDDKDAVVPLLLSRPGRSQPRRLGHGF